MDYSKLCEALDEIQGTPKRLEKTRMIAELLKEAGEDLERTAILLQGRLFPSWDKRTLGVSSRTMLAALARVTGHKTEKLEQEWSKTGDLGLIAEKHITKKRQATLFKDTLTVEHVYNQLRKLPTIEGKGTVDTKIKIIEELFSKASPLEARYITRTVLEELRAGIAEGTIRDGIIYAFLAPDAGIEEGEIKEREAFNTVQAAVQAAYDKTNDFAKVAIAAKRGIREINRVKTTIGKPLKVMLGQIGTNIAEAMKALGKPLLLQYKYDGFRVEVHKQGDRVQVFTRRLENVTKQFPDIVARVKEHVKCEECILDGEAIGINPKNKKYVPFQNISQRIKRKYGLEEMTKKLPVDVRFFDIIMKDGEEMFGKTMQERHELLTKTVKEGELIGVAHTLITSSEEAGKNFYARALEAGEEGIFAKKLDSVYQPGVRVGNWIKLKNTMEPLDLVVVGAEWGEGKRSGWLTSYTLACKDEEGELVEIGKAGTGLKELEEEGFSFKEMTDLLKPLVEYQEGKHVKVRPEIILEVAYEEIQKSPSYSSGYALRFPRIKRNRTDERSVDDVSTLDYVKKLYEHQRTQ